MEDYSWQIPCNTCGSLTARYICEGCFEYLLETPEISGFVNSLEYCVIEVDNGFLGFLCHGSWCLPKSKIKIEDSGKMPGETIDVLFKDLFNLDLSGFTKYKMITRKTRRVHNVFYVDCRKISDAIIQNIILHKQQKYHQYYNLSAIGILELKGHIIRAEIIWRNRDNTGKVSIPTYVNITNSFYIDDFVYDTFFPTKELKARKIYKIYVKKYNNEIFKKNIEYRIDRKITKSYRYKDWKLKDILNHTRDIWTSIEDPSFRDFVKFSIKQIHSSNLFPF